MKAYDSWEEAVAIYDHNFPGDIAAVANLLCEKGSDSCRRIVGPSTRSSFLLQGRHARGSLPDGGAPVDDGDAEDVVLSLATGVSDAALCQRFLIDPMRAARLRSAAEARYARLFAWLEDYRKDAVAQGFASYQGRRKYLEGLRSSDMDRRQRATRSVVRWLVKY